MAGKRSDGDGALRRRPNGLWECTLMVGYQEDGKRKYKSFYGKTQKEVKDKVEAYKRDVAAGLYVDKNFTFKEWADKWYEGYRDAVSPTTYESYGYTLKNLNEAFGSRKPDGSCIHIRQAVNLVKGKPNIGPTKSEAGVRDIPILPNIQACAVYLRERAGRFVWDSFIPGQPVNPSYFRKWFKSAIAQVQGVRVLTPHSCRHTYVSQLQALGVDMETIQSMVGHADIEMTQHYLHGQEETRQAAANKFSKAFSMTR